MRKSAGIIWLPALMGLVLIVLSQIDLYLLAQQSVDFRTVASREIPVVALGYLSCLLACFSGIVWAFKKQWKLAGQAVLSTFIFFALFIIGGLILNGVYINITV